jgi:hypothetical protein
MPSKSQLALEWPVFQPRGWGKPTAGRELPKPWFGLDTERDAKTGVFVCGWCVGETTFRFAGLRDFPSGTYWIWNLAYDIEGLLRDLRLEEAWAARADGAAFEILGGTATYYHGKRFSWRGNGKKITFIEASSFFGRQPLSAIGAKENIDASQMSLTRYQTDAQYCADVDKYCQQDARIVYEAIQTLSSGLKELHVDIGGTPGATARRFLATLGPFPAILWQTHKAFLRSYCGGRFEVTKRGVIPDVKQYDLVSAYPWALSQCPWLTDTAYSRQTRRYSPDALYGTYEVSFHYDNYLGVAPRWRQGIRVYSKRENSTWLTRPELEWLMERGANVHIYRGVEVWDQNATPLWKNVISELFALKKKNKTAPDKGWGAKIVLNSQYGVLIQLVRKSGKWVPISQAQNPVDFAGTLALEEPPKAFEGGKYFAPLYAGNLTGLTRCRILDAAEELGQEAYVGGHTDSVLTMGRDLKKGLGKELGDWELKETAARADISKTGMYAIGDVVKIRGITRKGTAALLWAENHIRRSRLGIKSAKSWDDVSVIVPKIVANNYSIENKRKWHGDVTRGLIAMGRFVDSEALELVASK